ncbi:hypothetical protein N657DRAFT_606433 [Parathielavia appendiculata]|uniref:Fungal N-terminal domain-containing protein n=1 Tax=Parathielavia appendiculata TaxID=2587402 RepID=A0AAN6TPL3_9PEZI|nr:hypothetical protein N657DRAFT_606433 [Parathielavia appendiculata]
MELGTVAAAAQFVDLGCRSLFGAYRFLKDLKDVPANLLFTLDDLGHFSGLMDDLRSAIEKADPRLRGITPTQSQRVTRILDSTADICKQLKELLAPCCPPAGSSSSRSRKLWRALISVKREIDIVNRCERLERLKHDLNRELQSCDLAMLTSVKSDLAAVSVNLQQTTSSLSAMEARLNSVAFPQTFRLGNNGIQDPKVAPLDQRDDPLPDTPIRSTTASLRPSQRPTVSVNQMIMELHRCLVLGEPPASTFDSSLRNTSRDEKAYVVSSLGCCHCRADSCQSY